MSNQVSNDPWESAENPQLRAMEIWGAAQIDTYYCVLQKGVGKIPFDPNVHPLDQRRTAIDIVVTSLPEMNMDKPARRELIAESREWAGIIHPSIKALGISARELNGKFVQVKFKPTGDTYTNGNGEVKEKTTFDFVKIFANEAACRADFQQSQNQPAGQPQAAVQSTAPNPNDNAEKQTALAFLKVIVENACKNQTDLTAIRNMVSQQIVAYGGPVAKFFTVDSPEAMQLIQSKMVTA